MKNDVNEPKNTPANSMSSNKSSKQKQSLFRKKKFPKNDTLKHDYFTSHKCNIPSEKINSYEIKCGPLRRCFLDLTSVSKGDIRATNLYRSYATLCAEKYRQYKFYPLSIHPFSILKCWLEVIIIFGATFNSFLLMIDATDINPNSTMFSETGAIVALVIFSTFELFYALNIILNFFTGYVEGNTHQYVVLELKKIAFHYLRTWFIPDVISTISVYPIYQMFTGSMDVNVYMILHAMKLLRIPILLKYLNNVLVVWRIGIFGKTLAEIFFLIYTYLVWNIYFQFTIELSMEGTFTPETPHNCSWISVGKLWDAKPSLRIAYPLDRAIGMLKKNANINLVEKAGCFESFFIVAWIIAKLLTYHCALKYIVCLFGKESAKAKYYIMTQQVATLINKRKFPPRIREKILKFYSIRFQSHYFAEAEMLSYVKGQLHEDIIMHTGRQLVQELEFLKQLPRSLLLQIGLKLKIVIFIAGDIIFKINTVGDCLYFIDKGTVAIYSESGNEICHLEDGDYFGEIALVMKHGIRTASVVAVTNCELFRLDKEDFDSSIACYPTVYKNIKKVAVDRYERTCVLDEHHKAELKVAQNHFMKIYKAGLLRDRAGSGESQ